MTNESYRDYIREEAQRRIQRTIEEINRLVDGVKDPCINPAVRLRRGEEEYPNSYKSKSTRRSRRNRPQMS